MNADKSRKYDRQIRLWGEHGQNRLECSNICLVNATAVGCEVLKSLVLPGIGGYTIVDVNIVTEEDTGTNFFLHTSSIGQSRAAACKNFLQDLNLDVRGDYVDDSVEYILSNRPGFFENFDVVVATNLNEIVLLKLSDHLWNEKVPFIYCRSLGFIGSIRLQIKEHCIVEAHPDNRHFDLRIEKPFPALKKHLNDTEVNSKVPWLLVLNRSFQIWQKESGKTVPKTYEEKLRLKELIRSETKSSDDNHEEAVKAVNTAFGGGKISSTLKAIFDDNACTDLDKKSDPFWIMANALRDFVMNDNNSMLPLPGVLPDMTADTESYINLQNIYRQQAQQDADAVYNKCRSLIQKLGLSEEVVTESAVRLMCREAAGLEVMRGSKISDEYENGKHLSSIIDDLGVQERFTEFYLAFRAYEKYLSEFGNAPGEFFVENDIATLKNIANKMISEWNGRISISNDVLHEICRYAGSEIHSISAFIGGCAAQEVIKIVTKQYKPINNTFLYNAITSETITFKL